jgi:DNA-binding SARP family transcriptional activator
MSILRAALFGKFRLHCQDQELTGLCTHKMQELFCYLLLHRDRPQPRETLAGLLSGDAPTAQSRKSLRQTLWHLQTTLESWTVATEGRLLQADTEWVQLNSSEPWLWLDVAVFEGTFSLVHDVPVHQLDPDSVQTMHSAVKLYQGDLLEGWYQDWCLYERERLQQMYLVMLDKLASYSEAHQEYEAGTAYGMQILRHDRARERTHRQLMRLYYLAGDRTEALRQYERCVAALDQELGVKPAQSTMALYGQIRADRLEDRSLARANERVSPAPDSLVGAALARLKSIQAMLGDLQRDMQEYIQTIERDLEC